MTELKDLKRYDEDYDEGGYIGISIDAEGEYFKCSDVEAIMPQWVSVDERLPVIGDNHDGYSDKVIVFVICNNGVKFVTIDRYDPYSKSWEMHYEQVGQNITLWQPLPPAPEEKK